MKKKLLTLLAVGAMVSALAAPAMAWENWTDPPKKYRTFQEYLDFYHAQSDEDTRALVEYMDARLAEGWARDFDADAYFTENLALPEMGITKENTIYWNANSQDEKGSYDEEWFRAEMLKDALVHSYRLFREDQAARQTEERFQALTQKDPNLYADFDPYAWFEGCYGQGGASLESFMTNWGLDEAGFKEKMFKEWADRSSAGFSNGYCVTVDGTPISFRNYRDTAGQAVGPRADNGRILIPVRAAAEALGLTVEWLPQTNQVTCADEEKTVVFTLNSLNYSGGALDTAPYAEAGVTYLPLRALGESLDCGVTWYQDFATAALTTQG